MMPSRRSFFLGTIAALIAARVPAAVANASTKAGIDAPLDGVTPSEARFPFFLTVPIPSRHVKLLDHFWAPRQEVTRDVSVSWITEAHDRSGGLKALRNTEDGYLADASVINMEAIKFIEAMAAVVDLKPDKDIDRLIEAWVQPLLAAQGPDGYLEENFPYGLDHPPQRWQTVWWSHETYTTGHYIEAAIAVRQATGKEEMYESALRAADNLVAELLDERRAYVSGHPEIEQALMRLYAETGQQKYLKLCGWLLGQFGRHDGRPSFGRMRQDHLPLKDQRTIEGHAVMAAYLFNGVTQYVGATGDVAYRNAVLSVWDDFVNRKMFIHGGGGNTSAKNEGYRRDPYCILPEDSYSESCSVVANFQWAHSLARLTGDAKYLNAAERMLYNAFYASLSLAGDSSFYRNPLQVHQPTPRSRKLATSCCPPNIVKLFNRVGGYFYSIGAEGLYINHYGASEAELSWRGSRLRIVQETDYPWDGEVVIRIDEVPESDFTLRLRMPGWATSWTLHVNGKQQDSVPEKGWLALDRKWLVGDQIRLTLAMPIMRVTLPSEFREYENRVALQRGPIVYCLEEQDLEANTEERSSPIVEVFGNLPTLYIPADQKLEATHRPDLLGGVTVLTGEVRQLHWDSDRETVLKATFVPYGVWGNREPGRMRVWLGARKARLVELLLPEQSEGASCVG